MVLLFLLLTQISISQDLLLLQINQFVPKMNQFIEAYTGCPEGTLVWEKETCSGARAHLDLKLWEEARARAAKLFNLRYPESVGKGRKRKK